MDGWMDGGRAGGWEGGREKQTREREGGGVAKERWERTEEI